MSWEKEIGLLIIISLFRNELYKFNNTGVRILDSIYHNYDIKIILKSHFWFETLGFSHVRHV